MHWAPVSQAMWLDFIEISFVGWTNWNSSWSATWVHWRHFQMAGDRSWLHRAHASPQTYATRAALQASSLVSHLTTVTWL